MVFVHTLTVLFQLLWTASIDGAALGINRVVVGIKGLNRIQFYNGREVLNLVAIQPKTVQALELGQHRNIFDLVAIQTKNLKLTQVD